jgi:nitrogen-specific signal transduction histidine kinase
VAQRVKIQQIIDSLVWSERLVALGKLATTVAHEVRNPLGGIRGAAQLPQIETKSDSEAQEYITVIIK